MVSHFNENHAEPQPEGHHDHDVQDLDLRNLHGGEQDQELALGEQRLLRHFSHTDFK
jgi:hypothetical protein